MSFSGIQVEPITNPDDFTAAFKAVANAFGHQTHDAIWIAFNPGWDTPEGERIGAQRLVDRFSHITTNRDGQPNTIFVKATIDNTIAGLAIWEQASVVPGYGNPPSDLEASGYFKTLYPENEREQRFLAQADKSLFRRRIEIINEKAEASPPAVFVMDLCAVDPKFQKRGLASKMVQYGLDEAKRRNLECVTEGSTMGRSVYLKLGFKQEGPETVYNMDDEFKDRDLPSNVVLRTGI